MELLRPIFRALVRFRNRLRGGHHSVISLLIDNSSSQVAGEGDVAGSGPVARLGGRFFRWR
jgi:hypothetical protein